MAARYLDALDTEAQRWDDLLRPLRKERVSEHTGRRARDDLRRRGLIEKFKAEGEPHGAWKWRRIILPTHLGQVDRGQVATPIQNNGFQPNELQLAHPMDGGQVEPHDAPPAYWESLELLPEEVAELTRRRRGKAGTNGLPDPTRETGGGDPDSADEFDGHAPDEQLDQAIANIRAAFPNAEEVL